MIVNKMNFLSSRGASMAEVLMAMAIVAVMTPFVYSQVSDTAADVRDIAMARRIIGVRDGVLNFVRMNQDTWPGDAQIKLDEADLAGLADMASVGFVDKYAVRGAFVTDVYLGVDMGDAALRAARIVGHIGGDAAVVDDSGVAYAGTWAVSAPEFRPGMIVYRISRDVAGEDKSRYLHRVASGDDGLNVMMRDLNMGHNDLFDVGMVSASAAKVGTTSAVFMETDLATATNVYFVSGANMDGNSVAMGTMRVTGDVTGFRTITAGRLNGNKFGTVGRVITDRASVLNSVNVSRDFNLKSDGARTISGFAGIRAGAVQTPYISADEMMFFENFGLTVSGELLMSTTAPIKFGAWSWPSANPPAFTDLTLSRAPIPDGPDPDEFGVIMSGAWQDAMPIDGLGGMGQ